MTTPNGSGVSVIGGGGHGREIAGVVNRCADLNLTGIHDDREPDGALLDLVATRWLGPVPDTAPQAYVGIGNPAVRRVVSTALAARPPALVDPSAVLADGAQLAAGVVVFPLASVSTNVTMGRHTHVCAGARIAHDCQLGEFVTVMPGVALGGHVTIGDDTYLGANSTVEHGVRIGAGVTVRTGSVVLADVPDGAVVAGNPAVVQSS